MLLDAAPVPDPTVERGREPRLIKGELPSPLSPPPGCVFNTRCPMAEERCVTEEPEWRELDPGRWVACHFAEPIAAASEYIEQQPNRPYVYFFSGRWSYNYETRRYLAPDVAGEDRSTQFGRFDLFTNTAATLEIMSVGGMIPNRFDDYTIPSGEVLHLMPFFQYVDRCTTRAHRMLNVGFAVEVPYFARRAFAGGISYFAGYPAIPELDQRVLTKLRSEVVPMLRTYPFVRIWRAGCSTGEEVYSLAILLKEEGLLERSIIYATDINLEALRSAEGAVYPQSRVPGYTRNYQAAGGTSKQVYMQSACSGGTGTFIEKTARKLQIETERLATMPYLGLSLHIH